MIPAVLDVNVIISGAISPSGAPRQLLMFWLDRRFTHVTSDEMIATVDSRLSTEELRRGRDVTLDDVAQLAALLRDRSVVVPTDRLLRNVVTGDPEDDGVLATAVGGNAEYLVTGDRRLLALRTHQGVMIVSPRQFVVLILTQPVE